MTLEQTPAGGTGRVNIIRHFDESERDGGIYQHER